jgi:hypothetical protein
MYVFLTSVTRILKIMVPDLFGALKIDILMNIEDDGPLRLTRCVPLKDSFFVFINVVQIYSPTATFCHRNYRF